MALQPIISSVFDVERARDTEIRKKRAEERALEDWKKQQEILAITQEKQTRLHSELAGTRTGEEYRLKENVVAAEREQDIQDAKSTLSGYQGYLKSQGAEGGQQPAPTTLPEYNIRIAQLKKESEDVREEASKARIDLKNTEAFVKSVELNPKPHIRPYPKFNIDRVDTAEELVAVLNAERSSSGKPPLADEFVKRIFAAPWPIGGVNELGKKRLAEAPPGTVPTGIDPFGRVKGYEAAPETSEQRIQRIEEEARIRGRVGQEFKDPKGPPTPSFRQSQKMEALKSGLRRGHVVIGKQFGEPDEFDVKTMDDAVRAIELAGFDPDEFSQVLDAYYAPITVISPKGKKGVIPRRILDAALAQGYKEIE